MNNCLKVLEIKFCLFGTLRITYYNFTAYKILFKIQENSFDKLKPICFYNKIVRFEHAIILQ